MVALDSYIEAAVWTGMIWESEGADPDPLDSVIWPEDVPDNIREVMLDDLEAFSVLVEQTCPEAFDKMSDAQMAHDFHLTRNRHGAGFWDRGLGELGDMLTELAHSFGSVELVGYRRKDGGVDVYFE